MKLNELYESVEKNLFLSIKKSNPDAKLSVDNEVVFKDRLWIYDDMINEHGEFPYQIAECKGRINVCSNNISSFKNFPKTLRPSDIDSIVLQFYEDYMPSFNSWNYFPSKIHGSAAIHYCKVPSFSNIDKVIQYFTGYLFINYNYTGPLLSFMKIPGFKGISALKDLSAEKKSQTGRACEIISKHITAKNDILDAKEELVSAGLKEYAKL